MSQRISIKDLEAAVKRINLMTGQPLAAYTKDASKPNGYRANIGNYHLDGATILTARNAAYALHQMDNEGGGVWDVLRIGHVSKPDLYQALHAYIAGFEASGL